MRIACVFRRGRKTSMQRQPLLHTNNISRADVYPCFTEAWSAHVKPLRCVQPNRQKASRKFNSMKGKSKGESYWSYSHGPFHSVLWPCTVLVICSKLFTDHSPRCCNWVSNRWNEGKIWNIIELTGLLCTCFGNYFCYRRRLHLRVSAFWIQTGRRGINSASVYFFYF